MQTLIIDLTISADEFLKQYQFPDAVVVTFSRCHRSVQFPANILQRFVTHKGISGSFRIQFDNRGKFMQIERV
ncbi:DUF2835 family protein [Oceanicoccus sp. KOV_DT_Chl]|uniref:DUF2835 family protein n=1 Tax=Oceanicoccus sp. KOV_DT_Chl TaxID=1904639 RepID=UPI000C7D0394|nr:DUF2835 family protein [Oceanicoccus sp. KOV_DT_Chl]